jgi:iron complex outermembrane recepter protein
MIEAIQNKSAANGDTSMRRLVLIGALTLAIAADGAVAAIRATREIRIAFDITAQPLGSALNQFALQSGVEILFLPRLTQGLRSRELRATASVDQALETLLTDSGLGYRRINTNSQGFLIEAKIDAHDPNEALTERNKTLASVIVTATRVSTLMQDTPMSVNVLTDEELTAAGATSLSAIAMLLPSLNESRTTSAETHRFTVRGVLGPGETTTGLYYNDIPVSGPTGTSADAGMALPELRLVDIKRVELLRGPQGTLYGAGAMGGSLRVLFNEPAFEQRDVWARGQASLTNDNVGSELAAAINVPLHHHTAARIVAYHDTTPGYIDNTTLKIHDVNHASVSGARLSINTNIAARANALFTAVHQQARASDAVTWSLAAGPYQSTAAVRLPFDNDFSLFNLRLLWQLNTSHLQLNSAHYSWDLIRRFNYTDTLLAQRTNPDACVRYQQLTAPCSAAQLSAYTAYVDAQTPAVLVQPMNVSAWIHEALWHGEYRALTWTTGIYLEDRHDNVDGQVLAANSTTGLPRTPFNYIGRRTLAHRLAQHALFGEIEISLTPTAQLTLGARAYDYAKSGTAQVTVSNYVSGLIAPSSLTTESHAGGTSFKVLLSRSLSEDLLLYAQAAQGFRPGGVNFNPGLAPELIEYRADSLWSYELGLKSTWFNQRFTSNIAMYQIDWRDMQYIVPTGTGASRYLSNLGTARNNGIEADLAAQVTDRLKISAHANFTDARLTEDQANELPTGLGQRGDRIPVIPQWSVSAALDYERNVTSSMSLGMRIDASYIGSAHTGFNASNAEYATLDSATLVNLRTTIKPNAIESSWRASIYVENMLDKKANTQVLNNLSGPPQASGPRPRTVGFALEYSFH